MSLIAALASALARCLTLFFPVNPFYSRLFPDKPIEGVLKSGWHGLVIEIMEDGQERVNRANYEICVLRKFG